MTLIRQPTNSKVTMRVLSINYPTLIMMLIQTILTKRNRRIIRSLRVANPIAFQTAVGAIVKNQPKKEINLLVGRIDYLIKIQAKFQETQSKSQANFYLRVDFRLLRPIAKKKNHRPRQYCRVKIIMVENKINHLIQGYPIQINLK